MTSSFSISNSWRIGRFVTAATNPSSTDSTGGLHRHFAESETADHLTKYLYLVQDIGFVSLQGIVVWLRSMEVEPDVDPLFPARPPGFLPPDSDQIRNYSGLVRTTRVCEGDASGPKVLFGFFSRQSSLKLFRVLPENRRIRSFSNSFAPRLTYVANHVCRRDDDNHHRYNYNPSHCCILTESGGFRRLSARWYRPE